MYFFQVKIAPLKDVSFKKVKLTDSEKYARNLDIIPVKRDKYPALNKEKLESFRSIILYAIYWTSQTDDSDTVQMKQKKSYHLH